MTVAHGWVTLKTAAPKMRERGFGRTSLHYIEKKVSFDPTLVLSIS